MKTGERLRVNRRMLSASRGIAWVAFWTTVAIQLVWLAIPVASLVRERDILVVLIENLGTVVYWMFPVGCLILTGVLFHFLPLYCVNVFLWRGVGHALDAEEHRVFQLVICSIGVLISVGVLVWYAREAVLLEIREFLV